MSAAKLLVFGGSSTVFRFWSALEAWLALILSVFCMGYHTVNPWHPKAGGTEHMTPVIVLCIVAGAAMGFAIVGMRFCKGPSRVGAWVAFVFSAIVLIDLANIFRSV